MRTDIKLGVVLGLGFLGVMAWYVTGRETPDPIPVVDSSLGNRRSAQADSGSAALPPPVINRSGDRSKKPGSSAGGAKSKSPSRGPVPGKVALAKLAARGGDRRKTVRPTSAAARTTSRPGTPARAMANTALDIKTGLSGKKNAKPPLVVPPGRKLAPTIRPEREASVTPSVDATPITKTTRDRPDKSSLENRVPILPKLKDVTTKRPKKVIRPMPAPRARPKERSHRIEKYDTFAVLAEKYYGSQRYAGLLAKANPQVKDPRRLKLGMKLRIPTRKDLLKPPSTSVKEAKGRAGTVGKKSGGTDTKSTEKKTAPKEKVYIVKRDESFYSIARKVWGKGSRWRELHKLNKDVCRDPRDLKPGMKLRISAPKSAKTKKTSSRR